MWVAKFQNGVFFIESIPSRNFVLKTTWIDIGLILDWFWIDFFLIKNQYKFNIFFKKSIKISDTIISVTYNSWLKESSHSWLKYYFSVVCCYFIVLRCCIAIYLEFHLHQRIIPSQLRNNVLMQNSVSVVHIFDDTCRPVCCQYSRDEMLPWSEQTS